jgi:hypothetical protein
VKDRAGVAVSDQAPAQAPRRDLFSGRTLYFVVMLAIASSLVAIVFLTSAPPQSNTTGPPHTCSSYGGDVVASCFRVGAPTHKTCPSSATFATAGCTAGDSLYTFTIEQSTVTFGDVALRVIASTGAVFSESGGGPGFSVLSLTGTVEAYWSATSGVMNMSSGWSYVSGGSNSTPITTTETIDVDVGTANLTGQGYALLAFNPEGAWNATPVTLP